MTARDWFGLTCAVLRWWPSALVSVAATVVTWLCSPVLAWLSFSTEDGNLPNWCYWLQTHDNHLDSMWKGAEGAIHRQYDSGGFFNSRLYACTNEEIAASKYLLWFGRVLWLWRNPAYGVANQLRFDTTDMVTVYEVNRGVLGGTWWHVFKLVRNRRGRYGFWWFGFYPWAIGRALRVQVGWKLQREDGMLGTHVNPFRKAAKKIPAQ